MKGRTELHPTGLHPASLAAEILNFMNHTRLRLLGLAAAADVVAADCRHNHWVLIELKQAGLSEERWMRSLEYQRG